MRKHLLISILYAICPLIALANVTNESLSEKRNRVILQQNLVKGVNTLTQEMLSESNTTYVIQYDYDLNNETITIPKNSTLCFEGGVIDNGRIVGSNTYIDAGIVEVLGQRLILTGSFNNEVIYSEWYGSHGNDSNFDDSAPIQTSIDNAIRSGIRVVQLLNKNYWIRKPLNVHSFFKLKGIKNSVIFNQYTKLSVCGDIDAIICNDAVIKNLQIEDIEIVGRDCTNNGIHIFNERNDISIQYCNFKNITITHFDNGIFIDIPGKQAYSAFFYCDFEGLFCAYNRIGMNMQGHFGDAERNKSVWMNCNRFTNCHFSHNRIGGVNIDGMKMCTNNVFDKCLIEKNGDNYDLALYNERGAFGIRLYSKNYPNYGGNIVTNSYFEANYPRRKGSAPSHGEICLSGYCYPRDFLENTKVANIIVENNQLDIENCISVNNKNVVLLANHGNSTIKGNHIYSLPLIKGLSTSRKFIETNDNNYASYIKCEYNTIHPATDVNFAYIHNNVTNPQLSSSYEFCKEEIYDGEPCEVKNGKYVRGTVYLMKNGINPSSKMHMLTRYIAGTDLKQVYYTLKNSIDGNRVVNVEVLSDISSTNASSEVFNSSVKYPKMYIYSSGLSKNTIDFSNSGNMPVVSDLIVENIVFKTNQVSVFAIKRDGLTLHFKNCEFVMDGNEALRLFDMNLNTCNIIFDNCVFRRSDISSSYDNLFMFFYGSSNMNAPQITFNGCTMENVNKSDYSVEGYGSSDNRPTHGHIGDMYFDTTVNKPIYIKTVDNSGNGTVTWVDATGNTI